jgi:LacI family transcriptional regulator
VTESLNASPRAGRSRQHRARWPRGWACQRQGPTRRAGPVPQARPGLLGGRGRSLALLLSEGASTATTPTLPATTHDPSEIVIPRLLPYTSGAGSARQLPGGGQTIEAPATIRQVAEAAGVSPATVSRVLSGTRRVDPELRAKTLAAVERLNYRANRVARALRTRSTGTVGMVVPNIANPFFPTVIQAVEKELRGHGVGLLLCDSGDDVGQESELVHSLLDHRIDGILFSPCDRLSSRATVRWAAARVPLVQIDRLAVADVAYVGADQESAMVEVVQHLTGQGCRRFAYVSPTSRASTAAERLRAYRQCVRRVDPRSAERVYEGSFSLEWGREAASRILAEGDLPDAIVCANDLVALGVLGVLRSHGVRVPGDVLLTGFDDTDLASIAWPPLTSVRQPLEAMGKEGAELVLAGRGGSLGAGGDGDAKGNGPFGNRLLKAELVIRESSCPGRQG